MDKNITAGQREKLDSYQGASAVILGYLKAERQVVTLSAFNKLIQVLGYDKPKREELITVVKTIQGDANLTALYEKGYTRELKLEDIPHKSSGEELKEKEVYSHVTPYIVDKERSNAQLREHRKLQRSGAHMEILMQDLKQTLSEEFKDLHVAKYLTTPRMTGARGEKTLIVCFSDWHVGSYVENKSTGGYSFSVLERAVNSVVSEVLDMVAEKGIREIHVIQLGDITEHVNMRNVSQAFDAEFNLSEQIAKATRLTVELLSTLSRHVVVNYTHIAGNHDRTLGGNKNDAISGDTTAYVILDSLFMVQENFKQLPNVKITDNRDNIYKAYIEVADKNVVLVHGDKEKKNETKIPKHIKDKPIDLLLHGHFHTSSITQEDYARYSVGVSSPMGANNFSEGLGFPTGYGSQMIVEVERGRESMVFHPLMMKKGEII